MDQISRSDSELGLLLQSDSSDTSTSSSESAIRTALPRGFALGGATIVLGAAWDDELA